MGRAGVMMSGSGPAKPRKLAKTEPPASGNGHESNVGPDDSLDPGLPNVGAFLYRLRSLQGLTLQEVADATDLSPSFLSAVERGQSDIALRRLARLAHLYNHDIGSLLGYSARRAKPQFVTSSDRLKVDRGEGIEYSVIRLPGVGFEFITATFAPRTAFRDEIMHEGIDIVYVTQGNVVLVYHGEEYQMKTGDCTVYSGAYLHRFRNDSDSPAQWVSVTTETVY